MSLLLKIIKILLFSLILLNTQNTFAIEIQQINNIQKESLIAKEKNLPLLILFSIEHCPFCQLVKEDFLKPMLISGNYKDKVIIRELHADMTSTFFGRLGEQQSALKYARKMGISLYPTMVFIDEKGCQLSENIKGVNTPSMFGGRIDMAIDEANEKLKKGKNNC